MNFGVWIEMLSNIFQAAINVVKFIENDTSVLIHCSDGWDR
jgi:hypothetical protein